MTSTLKKHTPRPPGGGDCHDSGYSNGTLPNSSATSIDTDDTGSSHCDSVPEFMDLTIVLPDGREQTINVASSKQMMDLLVQVTASNKLSPADHSLKVMSNRHEWMSTFKASQTIGSLRTDVVHLVSKKAEKEKKMRKPQLQQPFEITQRLTVNLPHSQKMMMRISRQMTLAEIFHMICTEKNLDPYKYELRHPTNPNEALNMASPLNHYHLNTISIINIAGDTSYPSSDSTLDFPSSEDSDCNTMLRWGKGSKEPPSEPEPFMPGMASEKKKKGFFSFFRKKGSAKFKPSKMSYPESQPSLTISENNKARPKSMFATLPLTRSTSSSNNNVPTTQPASATLQKSQSVRSGPPAKPPRKKRPAPPPPVAASTTQNSVNQSLPNIDETTTMTTKEITVDVLTAVAHSRHSSHSSGFNETTSSPLESPGNSSHDSTAHVTDAPETDTQAKPDLDLGESPEIKDNLPSEDLVSEVGHPPSEASVENNEQESAPSQPPGDELESSTLHRKRKAPAPPPTGVDVADGEEVAPPERPETPPASTEGDEKVCEPVETTTTLVEALQMENISIDTSDSTPVSPINEKPSSPLGGSFVVEDKELKGALVEELRNGDVQNDSMTEDSSPKSDVTAMEGDTTVTSQPSGTNFKNTSDVANFIEQMLQQTDDAPAPSSDNAAVETTLLSVDCSDGTSQKDKNETLPLVSAVESETSACVVTSSAPVIHEECSAVAEVSMPTEVLQQNNDDSYREVTTKTEIVTRTSDDDRETVSIPTEDVHQNTTQAEAVPAELSSRDSSSEESPLLEGLGLPAVVYKVPVNNRNGQSSAIAKEPVTQQRTSIPSKGVMCVQTTQPEKSEKTGELYTFSVTTEYVIKDDVSPVKEPPAPSTPEAPMKDDAMLFKVPSVPRMKQTPRVNSLREVYHKPILSNSYIGGSNGRLASPTRELIPPPLSAASREAAVKSTREVSRKSSYDSIAKVTAPRPWGTRYQSEPSVKDVRKALLICRDSSLTRDVSSPGDCSLVQESPSRKSSFSSSSEINFQPSTADESQSVLEEKSISMLALPSERKTTPRKRAVWSDRRHYSSMVSLATQNESALSLPPSSALQNSSSMEQLAMTPNSRDKARRTLQSQYSELQMQFSKWQQQLMKNQALLTQKNLLTRSNRPRDTSRERDGYRRATSRGASDKRRSFTEERPASYDRDLRRVTSGVTTEKQRSFIDDPPTVQNTTQEVREGTVEDLTSIGVQSPQEGTVVSGSNRVGRLSRSTGLRDTGLGGKFTPGELTSTKRVLRQNSDEIPPTTTVFKAMQNSTTLPRQSASTAWRTVSPAQQVGSSVRQSRSPTRQSQGRWSTSQRVGSPGQRSGSPPPGVLLTRDAPQKVTSMQMTKLATSRSREVNRKRFEPKLDPREELMIAIRNAGAKNILKKSSSTDAK